MKVSHVSLGGKAQRFFFSKAQSFAKLQNQDSSHCIKDAST